MQPNRNQIIGRRNITNRSTCEYFFFFSVLGHTVMKLSKARITQLNANWNGS